MPAEQPADAELDTVSVDEPADPEAVDTVSVEVPADEPADPCMRDPSAC